MSLIGKARDIFRANVNHTLTKMEDPEKMIKNYIMDMESSIEKTTISVAQAIANTKTLGKKLKAAEEKVQDWNDKAKAAVNKGDDELAKAALERRKIEQLNVDEYKPMYENAEKISGELTKNLEKFKRKLELAKARQGILIARASQAKTQKELNQILADIGGKTGFSKFNKYEEKITDMESEAEAYGELHNIGTEIEDQFRELDEVSIEQELEEFKKNMNK